MMLYILDFIDSVRMDHTASDGLFNQPLITDDEYSYGLNLLLQTIWSDYEEP